MAKAKAKTVRCYHRIRINLSPKIKKTALVINLEGTSFGTSGATAQMVGVHAPDAPVRARIFWQYGNTGGSLGVTDKFGNITIQPGLTEQALRETVRHEGVHRFFSPQRGGDVVVVGGTAYAVYELSGD
jgi:hypothetical protein